MNKHCTLCTVLVFDIECFTWPHVPTSSLSQFWPSFVNIKQKNKQTTTSQGTSQPTLAPLLKALLNQQANPETPHLLPQKMPRIHQPVT